MVQIYESMNGCPEGRGMEFRQVATINFYVAALGILAVIVFVEVIKVLV